MKKAIKIIKKIKKIEIFYKKVLTIKKVNDIIIVVRKLFNNKDLAVQTYAKPRLVTRKAWNEFISERR